MEINKINIWHIEIIFITSVCEIESSYIECFEIHVDLFSTL